MIQLQSNRRTLPEVELDLSVDEDDEGRVGLTINLKGGGEDFEWYTEDPDSIEEFFLIVGQAQDDWKKANDS